MFPFDDDDDGDGDDDDNELFLWYGWPTKGVKPYFQPGPLLEILTIANLRHAASRVVKNSTRFKFVCFFCKCPSIY